MDKKCIVCKLDFVWENGSTYCWNCVNENVVLINQYYSRLDNKKNSFKKQKHNQKKKHILKTGFRKSPYFQS